MNRALNDLKKYILEDDDEPTFKSKFTGSDFEEAVDWFMEMLEDDMESGASFLMDLPDMGCSWLETYYDGSYWYWNIDDIWNYWTILNRNGYFA